MPVSQGWERWLTVWVDGEYVGVLIVSDEEEIVTDSILREAEARGVEKFGEHVKAYNYSAGWQSKHFAEQMREGKA